MFRETEYVSWGLRNSYETNIQPRKTGSTWLGLHKQWLIQYCWICRPVFRPCTPPGGDYFLSKITSSPSCFHTSALAVTVHKLWTCDWSEYLSYIFVSCGGLANDVWHLARDLKRKYAPVFDCEQRKLIVDQNSEAKCELHDLLPPHLCSGTTDTPIVILLSRDVYLHWIFMFVPAAYMTSSQFTNHPNLPGVSMTWRRWCHQKTSIYSTHLVRRLDQTFTVYFVMTWQL